MSAMQGMERRAVLLSLIDGMAGEGSWCGETHVQKCVYFLQSMLNVPTGFDFILYKHGPFSFDLRDELTAMRADDLIGLEVQSPYGPSLRLCPAGREVANELYRITTAQYKDQVDFVAGRISNRGVSELERLGTALYLYVTKEEMGPGSSPESVEIRAGEMHRLKPHVSVEQAQLALSEVDKLISESQGL